jgi:hypothetical protein
MDMAFSQYAYDDNGNMTSGYDLTDPASVASRTITWNIRDVHLEINIWLSANLTGLSPCLEPHD